MKLTSKIKLALLSAALVFAVVGTSHADDPEEIDVKVSINATKSVVAPTTFYDFGALSVNTASHSATALIVRNDSGGLIETYEMSAGDALEDGAGTDDWTLAGSTGTDTYVLDAQFSDARPADALNATWGSDNLTTTPTACSATVFGNGTAGEAGLNVSPITASRDRNLWFRIITPDAVTSANPHTATVTIAVQ